MSGVDHVLLAGLDFGSTTSCMVLASARWEKRSATGRVELGVPELRYRSAPVFTPFEADSNCIDVARVEALLDTWTAESSVSLKHVFAGGVIITGLAAQRGNAASLAQLIGERFGEMVIATANDPGLESWLAFMGNCSRLSQDHVDESFLNLDIGGGTTNPARGRAGNVSGTGCYAIGARHVQFRPGTWELTDSSSLGQRILQRLAIPGNIGDTLDEDMIDRLVDYFVCGLEALAMNAPELFSSPDHVILVEQVLDTVDTEPPTVITLSGGIGELVYRAAAGEPLPGRSAFGDLGVELARGILRSPVLSRDLNRWQPEALGRATVYGLSLHSTELSGATVFLPRSVALPLHDVPIVARIPFDAEPEMLDDALMLVRCHTSAICLQLLVSKTRKPDHHLLKDFAGNLYRSLVAVGYEAERPLILLMESNMGKSVGHYVTDWGRRPLQLVVVDEVPDRHAHFVNLGNLRDGVIPVACFGVG